MFLLEHVVAGPQHRYIERVDELPVASFTCGGYLLSVDGEAYLMFHAEDEGIEPPTVLPATVFKTACPTKEPILQTIWSPTRHPWPWTLSGSVPLSLVRCDRWLVVTSWQLASNAEGGGRLRYRARQRGSLTVQWRSVVRGSSHVGRDQRPCADSSP